MSTDEFYSISLHDALPIWFGRSEFRRESHGNSDEDKRRGRRGDGGGEGHENHHHAAQFPNGAHRSEEHTSELQSPCKLVCRLLLEKKKKYHALIYVHPYDH